MLLPAVIYVLIFSYVPMSGLVLAFEKYQYRGGIYNSPWIGLQNFKAIMIDGKLPGVTRNTILYNIAFIFLGVIFEMGSAILINELRNKLNMAVILITHDLGIVSSMCDRIAVMYAGKVVECGTTDDIFYKPQHEYTKGLLRSVPNINDIEPKRLIAIEGTPVDLLNPPAGCPFAPRCPSCMKICLREMPPYHRHSDLHTSACWLYEKAEAEGSGKEKEE